MKKKIIFLFVIVVMLASLLSLSACGCRTQKEEVYYGEAGFFKYRYTPNDKYYKMCIYDVTEEALDQEVLVVPYYIDGVLVDGINRNFWEGIGFKTNFGYLTAKKVYVPSIEPLGIKKFDNRQLETIVFYQHVGRIDMLLFGTADNYVVIEEYYDEQFAHEGINYIMANFLLMNNYPSDNGDGEKYAWADYVPTGEGLSVMPIEPICEGYIFSGWYSEPECVHKVDLSNFKMGEGDTTFYAGWIEK